MRTSSKQPWALLALIALSLVVALAPPAAAQEDDPYGGTTTTTTSTPPGQQTSCRLRDDSADPGAPVSVTVRMVTRGATVRLLFDGSEQARTVAAGPGNSPRVNVEMTFVVPADAEPGEHQVVAVGPDFSVECVTNKGASFEVLASGVLSSEDTRGFGGLSLPRTGIYVGLLVAVAAALLLVGRSLVVAARRRRAADAQLAIEVARERRASSLR